LDVSTSDFSAELPGPTIYSNLRAQVQFHLHFNPIYDRLISRPGLTVNDVLRLDSKIDEWMIELPSFFQEEDKTEWSQVWLRLARYRLFWRVRSHRISLFYPVLLQRAHDHPVYGNNAPRPTDAEQSAFRSCLKYAHQTVVSVDEYFRTEALHVLGEWYALQVTVPQCIELH
jgi:hypothetical protein